MKAIAQDFGPFLLGTTPAVVRLDPMTQGGLVLSVDVPQLTIIVGIQDSNWRGVVAVLVHEALEYLLHSQGLSWSRSDDHLNAADARLFCFTHGHWSVLCGQLGSFLVDCMPELSLYYAKHRADLELAEEIQAKEIKDEP